MVSLQGDIGLDNRNETLCLANESVSSKISHVCLDDQIRRLPGGDVNLERRSPLCKLATSSLVLCEANGKGVQALHHSGSILTWKGIYLQMGFTPGTIPLSLSTLGKRSPELRFDKSSLGRESQPKGIVRNLGFQRGSADMTCGSPQCFQFRRRRIDRQSYPAPRRRRLFPCQEFQSWRRLFQDKPSQRPTRRRHHGTIRAPSLAISPSGHGWKYA